MSDHQFEPPWSGNNLSLEDIPDFSAIGQVVCRLEYLLRKRKKLSCPNDDVDNRILLAVRRAMDSIQPLLVGHQDLTDVQKRLLIRNSRLSIKEANSVIEKTLKIRSK
ncbi:Hypothetical protein CINCED_3A005884 [Cinara cedri]|uniref:Uncharacterized protein n=1 Tax=Cinara cedri TaxID=506608 RepID=A0A5E4MHN8_9HEMI|nr:Hypothetical protein CINCED_3A005884 [Cinara cedri]